jgi:hypothetical protein
MEAWTAALIDKIPAYQPSLPAALPLLDGAWRDAGSALLTSAAVAVALSRWVREGERSAPPAGLEG